MRRYEEGKKERGAEGKLAVKGVSGTLRRKGRDLPPFFFFVTKTLHQITWTVD
jgi:hypothetical protein